ncbi:MAG: Cache 3/Cache 2 fusion domain-containing protein, partial [Bacteroidota bacterium]
MRKLNDMKIGLRLNLVLSAVMVLIIASIGIYTLRMQKNNILSDTDARMFEQVEDLTRIITLQIEQRQKENDLMLDFASKELTLRGGVAVQEGENDSEWLISGERVDKNFGYVDYVTSRTGALVSVFKKTANGFIRVSTSVKDEQGNRQLGTHIPIDSPVAKAINQGQNYSGRAIVVDEWYLTTYTPIYDGNELIGTLGVGQPEKDMSDLKDMFDQKQYFETGYPYLVSADGELVIHPSDEGESLVGQDFFEDMKNANQKEAKTEYVYEGKNKFQYFKYIEPIESYVAVTIYESELMGV